MHLLPSNVRFSLSDIGLAGLGVLLGLSLTLAACDNNEHAPPTGTLSGNISTDSDNTNPDGDTVLIGSQSSDVQPSGSTTFSEVEDGPHEGAVSSLDANCSVDASPPTPRLFARTIPPASRSARPARATSAHLRSMRRRWGEPSTKTGMS